MIVFKEILGKLGLNNIRFALKQKDNSEDSNGNNEEDSKKKKISPKSSGDFQLFSNNRSKLNKSSLLKE